MADIPPIYYRQVTQWDRDQSIIIEDILKNVYNQYELETDRKRIMVMKELNKIIKEWI